MSSDLKIAKCMISLKRILIAGLLLIIFGCSEKTSNTDQNAILSGKIANLATPEIFLYSLDRTKKIKLPLQNGYLKDTIPINEPTTFYLSNSSFQHQVYLEPGYHLTIDLDAQDSKKEKGFKGKGAATNNYRTKSGHIMGELEGDFDAFYSLEPQDFKNKVDFINDSLIRLLDQTDLKDLFKEKERRHLGYWKKLFLKQYPMIHPNPNHIEYFKKTDLFDSTDLKHAEDLIYSDAYSFNLKYYYTERIDSLIQTKKFDEASAHFYVYKRIPDQKIRNYLLFNWAEAAITRTQNLDSFRGSFLDLSTNKDYNDQIDKIYQNLKRTAPGAPSPVFSNYENYAGGKASLPDFKGKYVFIDVWATWCKPCIAELPALKELEERYKDDHIEFISISIDKQQDQDTWRQMIKDKNMGGTQLFANSSANSEFIEAYEISYIPRFIFIDPSGNIIQSQAPPPSSKEVTALFDSYLNP